MWWRSAVIYQVYPRSFADGDGDGMGDLRGITDRLEHLRDLGADAVWLSPFYPSPQADAGYDVSDYCGVDELFGTLDDAEALITRAHQLGLRVVVDLVPNHTSDEHPWFQRALAASPGSPERDRYIFRDVDPTDPERPPNNWESIFGGPAWTKVPGPSGTGDQWYLHLFDSRQPDLNWDDPEVRASFLDVLRFWLDLGVDGFRVDVAHGLVKAPGLPDVQTSAGDSESMAQSATPYWDQDGVHEIYRDWRRLLDSYPGDRMMVAEAWVQPLERIARYIRPGEHHQAFNFSFLDTPWDADLLRHTISESYRVSALVDAPTTWVLSNHDVIRHATRLALPPEDFSTQLGREVPAPDRDLGLRRARAATTLMLALPGSAYIYQGEELGLPEVLDLPADVRQDPTFRRTEGERLGRDGCRVPLPWRSDAPGFGFGPDGAQAPWLPQPAEFAPLAADVQRGDASSTLELYRRLLRLRRDRNLGDPAGTFSLLDLGPSLVAFEVTQDVTTRVVLNLGDEEWPIPEGWAVVATSTSADDAAVSSQVTVLPDCAVWLTVIG
ncbi:glycoside hydrolase family 13 protein [Corynebacterium sp. AOP40-9SA-29]|uniref:glycoside hydrolase family 13 protein n=1 Tax=Corynebacterium sp. AOP40-9SA-29 TaxID=3457677 RepID=UPI004033D20C